MAVGMEVAREVVARAVVAMAAAVAAVVTVAERAAGQAGQAGRVEAARVRVEVVEAARVRVEVVEAARAVAARVTRTQIPSRRYHLAQNKICHSTYCGRSRINYPN